MLLFSESRVPLARSAFLVGKSLNHSTFTRLYSTPRIVDKNNDVDKTELKKDHKPSQGGILEESRAEIAGTAEKLEDFLSLQPVKHPKTDLFESDPYHLSQSWKHPMFSIEQMKSVPVSHFEPKNWSDKVAWKVLTLVRSTFDLVTGYKHPPPGKEMDPSYSMSERQWLTRFVFLESIAGVPGMVGGMVRHLHSLRLLRRDRAWIETLLEEAYNERMHLLTFIKLTEPGWMMRLTLLGAQGVFFNGFFVCYLMFPRICHRFVGYLEEEAVITYTRCINDLENGLLPEFSSKPAPDVALQYWNMPKGSTVKDLIYYVRADECKHREVNHTFGNLDQTSDPNPYSIDVHGKPHPRKDLKYHNLHPVGWQKDEIPLK